MPGWKDLLQRAKQLASEHLPEEVKDAGRRWLGDAPAPTSAPRETTTAVASIPKPAPAEDYAEKRAAEALARLRSKATHGLKPEDRLVVIYATDAERDAVREIREALAGIETTIREMDLRKEPPQTARQLAKLTNVMVPPYVYINGRFWGAQYEMMSLRASGDLEHVVANRLDVLSEGAKRIGNVRETYSEALTVPNIVERWKLGHILCVDDLDSWYEVDRDGTPHFYYQGGPRDPAEMEAIAAEIVAGVEAQAFEARWMLEPSVQLVD